MNVNPLPSASAEAVIQRDHYKTTVHAAGHVLHADEPASLMGGDTGMAPYSLLLASLGSCTCITLRMYIDRKMWVVDEISVHLDLYKTETGTLIERSINFKGELTEDQHKRLIVIANSCPVHKILTGNIDIKTS
jgi:putative redox protein